MLVFENAALLVPGEADLRPGMHVLVEGDRIREVSENTITASDARRIDLRGKTLMPGLIDCHAHVIAIAANLSAVAQMPNTLVAFRAIPLLASMLARGFTTVRDCGGADPFLAQAVAEGLIAGPRLFPSGKALSQTGGHADFRQPNDTFEPCMCSYRLGAMGRVVDGVDAVRQAAREELQRGATQLKVMASGGVASPTDRIDSTQYSLEELRAVVEEAEATNTYVAGHAYTPRAIARAVECGVRTIEHGNLVDDEAARLMAQRGAFAVPTLVTYAALASDGAALGLPPESVAKIEAVRIAGFRSLEIFKRAGVRMGFGTDLLGEMHARQSEEFALRAEVLSPVEIIESATAVGAAILRREGHLGVVAPDAYADLLVVDGDPLRDLALLGGQGEHLTAIVQGGRFVKNELR